jgi:hypothetical protein
VPKKERDSICSEKRGIYVSIYGQERGERRERGEERGEESNPTHQVGMRARIDYHPSILYLTVPDTRSITDHANPFIMRRNPTRQQRDVRCAGTAFLFF